MTNTFKLLFNGNGNGQLLYPLQKINEHLKPQTNFSLRLQINYYQTFSQSSFCCITIPWNTRKFLFVFRSLKSRNLSERKKDYRARLMLIRKNEHKKIVHELLY